MVNPLVFAMQRRGFLIALGIVLMFPLALLGFAFIYPVTHCYCLPFFTAYHIAAHYLDKLDTKYFMKKEKFYDVTPEQYEVYHRQTGLTIDEGWEYILFSKKRRQVGAKITIPIEWFFIILMPWAYNFLLGFALVFIYNLLQNYFMAWKPNPHMGDKVAFTVSRGSQAGYRSGFKRGGR